MDECIFCGRDAVVPEHIFARKWVQKLWRMNRKDRLYMRHTRGKTEAAEPFDVMWDRRLADLVAQCVCDECNSGWMNALDYRAQQIIGPHAMDGREIELRSLIAVHTLSWWLAKLAFMFDYTDEIAKIPVPSAHLAYQTRRPLPRTRIWIIHSPPLEPGHLAGYTWSVGESDFYLAAIRVEGFLAYLSIPLREDVRVQFPSESGAVTHLWPPTGRVVRIPTSTALDSVEFVAVCNEFVERHQRASAAAAARRR